ncbi:urea amidolyase associated protein UAAP1 [Rhodoferax sp. GW822-FHT02A01]|uniref:urea amidolyase associated protein UAAP1 n=1 Tax=Rhodoferax sp. GW822-FHT02A01 TaxID=3141537 RepID=UPI00315C6FA5
MRRGNTLRITDVRGSANVSMLLYNAEEKTERYNMPDTLKAQHTAYLTAGHVCYSDMGRVLCSIAADTCGWHDTVCGASTEAGVRAKYGEARYQEHRNAMHRNGTDSLVNELEKWGLSKRDMAANLNLFSKVQSDEEGCLQFATAHRASGQYVDLRFEMDTLVVLSTAQHPLDPNPAYAPQDVTLTVWRSGTAGADDPCRLHCPENGRGLINTERYYL